MTMRLATWNINGLRARFDFLLHWLDARQPDVVGLQELKLEDEKFPSADLESVGYRALTHGQKAWNGVAILSREPATLVQQGLPGQEDLGARLITRTPTTSTLKMCSTASLIWVLLARRSTSNVY